MTDFDDDLPHISDEELVALERTTPMLVRIRRFAEGFDNTPWFANLGEAPTPGLRAAAERYLDGLGFPDAARAALATARAEGLSDDAAGLGGFLRSQFDVRSTTPQEGAGPDAVLSRAEAAVKEGRVADALAELEALPEVARAEMTDWMGQAQSRADVLDAIATLTETYQ